MLLKYVKTLLIPLQSNPTDKEFLSAFWIAGVQCCPIRESDESHLRQYAATESRHMISYPLMAFILEMMLCVNLHKLNPRRNLEFHSDRPYSAYEEFIPNNFTQTSKDRFYDIWFGEYQILTTLMGDGLIDAAWYNAKIALQRLKFWPFPNNWISSVSDKCCNHIIISVDAMIESHRA